MTLVHPLLADWRLRLEVALEMAVIDSRSAWFWRVRAKVLKYLILRHGEDLSFGRGPVAPVPVHPVFLEARRGGGRPVRSPDLIRGVLEKALPARRGR